MRLGVRMRETKWVSAEIRYAKSGNVHIAYQVVGDGPFDLVIVPAFVSNIELDWEIPQKAAFYERLTSFSRLIILDKRGTGLSDRVSGVPSLETRMGDVRAVLDSVGSERTALCGFSEGGPISLLFAATYPERSMTLVLYGTMATFVRTADHPWNPTVEETVEFSEVFAKRWAETGGTSQGAGSAVRGRGETPSSPTSGHTAERRRLRLSTSAKRRASRHAAKRVAPA
jgi:pimeloyl-ACP methyl ester carboxylesterase